MLKVEFNQRSGMMEKYKLIINWEEHYQTVKNEDMHWYIPDMDENVSLWLKENDIHSGKVLDIGTGPATQAIAFTKLGFNVTATDISETAIKKAREKALNESLNIHFIQDDILNTSLKETFNLILDRGCFHVIDPDKRMDYANIIYNLLEPDGILLLSTFSSLEPGEEGPYRFHPDQINEYFGKKFSVVEIKDTFLQGLRKPIPHALFCVIKKKISMNIKR